MRTLNSIELTFYQSLKQQGVYLDNDIDIEKDFFFLLSNQAGLEALKHHL